MTSTLYDSVVSLPSKVTEILYHDLRLLIRYRRLAKAEIRAWTRTYVDAAPCLPQDTHEFGFLRARPRALH